MWFLPLRITLELKKTRTSWTLTIRVLFNSQENGRQAKACLPLPNET